MYNAANNASSQLAQAISAADTSLTVLDGSSFPDAPFVVSIEDEIIEVGAKDGSTFSALVRGLEGTTPASHVSGARVENRFTAGTYQKVVDEIDAHKAEKVSDVGGVHGLIYEKGVWTPTLMFSGYPASDASFTSEGSYIRIGNKVHCNLLITITNPGTIQGSVQFGGLPFGIGSRFRASVASSTNFALPTDVTWLFLRGNSGTHIQLYGVRSNDSPLAIINTDIIGGTRIFETQFSYYI